MPRFELRFLSEYSDEMLLEELRRAAAAYTGTNLTQPEFMKLSPKVSAQTLQRRFGTWGKAIERAGLAHLYQAPKRFTSEDCFENLANVWTHLGRPPEYLEMKSFPSVIGPKAYSSRWGTWRKALAAFVEWSNREGAVQANEVTASTMPRGRRVEDDPAIRPGLRFMVFLRDRFRCLVCGRSPATHLNVELHADHAKSIYDGGKTIFENLQTLCQDCNLGKGRTSARMNQPTA